MSRTIKSQKLDTVVALMVFCVFAASVLMVLTLGGSIYKSTNELYQEGYEERTGLSYIWSKVKNGDESGSVYIDSFQGLSVLCLDEEYGGVTYQTKLYLYDGWIYELFCEADLEFSPEEGIPVMQIQSLDFKQMENGLIKAASDSEELIILPRSKRGIRKGVSGVE